MLLWQLQCCSSLQLAGDGGQVQPWWQQWNRELFWVQTAATVLDSKNVFLWRKTPLSMFAEWNYYPSDILVSVCEDFCLHVRSMDMWFSEELCCHWKEKKATVLVYVRVVKCKQPHSGEVLQAHCGNCHGIWRLLCLTRSRGRAVFKNTFICYVRRSVFAW